jgi:hypothetical protein
MRSHRSAPVGAVFLTCLSAALAPGARADAPARPPFPYVYGKAYHVLPETHNNQSGYFSLCEGLDGQVYVGTAKYGENAYLVEFDPKKESQRVVLDTNAVCGLSARGYAAQAKLHTRNFVGPSGRIYVGSKQGYPIDGDKQTYPGGYAMVYDPRLGKAFNLGMPFKTEGVIDVAADESRGVLYVVTCENQHWMRADLKEDGPNGRGDGAPRAENWRELGPSLARYASTLIAVDGCAYALTADFQIARYDPAADKVSIRPIEVGGRRFAGAGQEPIPTWVLAKDRKSAYLIFMSDPTLMEVPLSSGEGPVRAAAFGKMVEGKGPDCRCALTLHPDGRVYALIHVQNETGFGESVLHHLTRFDPASRKIEDLGVVAVQNPDYFPLSLLDSGKQAPPNCNGFRRLPDGTWVPTQHMALMAAQDGTLYATFLGPFTVLRIDACKLPPKAPSAAARFIDSALRACDRADTNLPALIKAAETIARRHLDGGLIGFPFQLTQPLAAEMWGRSGGMIHVGLDRPIKPGPRTDREKAKDVVLVAYQAAPSAGDLEELKQLRSRGCYVLGFGPRDRPGLADVVAACDEWIDTAVSETGDEGNTGSGSLLSNLVHGWCLTGEVVAVLNRHGKMPTMWKSFGYADAPAWGQRYLEKKQFHDDFQVPPAAPGALARSYLHQVRHALSRLRADEPKLVQAADYVAADWRAGRKTVVAWSGHLGYARPNPFQAQWSQVVELEPTLAFEVEAYRKATPDGSLVLRLGGNGRTSREVELFAAMRQRVIYFAGDHPATAFRAPAPDAVVDVPLGFAFGDACVPVQGYPIRILPPSGILQLAAFGAIEAQVRATSSEAAR